MEKGELICPRSHWSEEQRSPLTTADQMLSGSVYEPRSENR